MAAAIKGRHFFAAFLKNSLLVWIFILFILRIYHNQQYMLNHKCRSMKFYSLLSSFLHKFLCMCYSTSHRIFPNNLHIPFHSCIQVLVK